MRRGSLIAKNLVAVPMGLDDPDIGTIRQAHKALMLKLKVDNSWKLIYESFLTFREGSSNKFHYFGVFKNRSGECVGGNAYGRIGYNAQAIEIARGSESSVMSDVSRKEEGKRDKGYVSEEE